MAYTEGKKTGQLDLVLEEAQILNLTKTLNKLFTYVQGIK